MKTGTKALVVLTILVGALATSAIALPTLAAPLMDRDQLQSQDQLRDQDRLQTCDGNGDGNCTRACICDCNCVGGPNQGSGTRECFQLRLGALSQGEGQATHRYGSCGSMSKGN